MSPNEKSSAHKAHTSAGIHKTKPKQPLTRSDQMKRLFKSLCAQVDGRHYKNAIKTCEKILRLDTTDKDALQTKLFLLLQTEQYDVALRLVDSIDKESNYNFEKAYSLYHLQRENEARNILKLMKEQESNYYHRGAIHLEAQMDYREGSYQAALSLYQDLLNDVEPQSEEHSDILTNLQASQLHLDFITTRYLHALDSLPGTIRNQIEMVPPPTQSTSLGLNALAAVAIGRAPAEITLPAVKKVRRSRVPPNVVPGVSPPPDPERWVKKSERSSFWEGKRRKGFSGSGATQGSVNVDVVVPTSIVQSNASGGKKKKKRT